jgi:hypothetical protein
VLRKFGFVVPMFVITVVLPEPYVKWSTSLPCILLITVGAYHLVYAAFFHVLLVDGCFVEIKFTCIVLCFEGNIKNSMFENFSN